MPGALLPCAACSGRRGAQGGGTTAHRTTGRAAIALALVLGASIFAPASADTKTELDAAKRDYEAARARLQAATARWQRAQSRLETLKDDIAEIRQRIAEHQAAIGGIERVLQRRAILAFQAGPASTIDVLLSSASITELSDRLEFLESLTQGDADLVTSLQAEQQRLAWDQEALAAAIEDQSIVTADYREARADIAAQTARLGEIFEDLKRRYRQEQRSLVVLGQSIGTGFIERCPVAGPNSFVDSFGWPRSDGRTHEGIDLIAATGTPVVAAHSGIVTQGSSSLGGIQAYVRASSGTFTFYAHLNGYSDASGSVSAGTVIGYVGSTGNAGTPHLHFELHPGGGDAVNPYAALLQVC